MNESERPIAWWKDHGEVELKYSPLVSETLVAYDGQRLIRIHHTCLIPLNQPAKLLMAKWRILGHG